VQRCHHFHLLCSAAIIHDFATLFTVPCCNHLLCSVAIFYDAVLTAVMVFLLRQVPDGSVRVVVKIELRRTDGGK
jgi:hypothetical protein